jgi:hypothetical protein
MAGSRLEAVPGEPSNPTAPPEGERTAYEPAERVRAAYPAGVGPPRRRSRSLWRPREAGAAAARTVGWGVVGIGRLVLAIAILIALLIGLAIVLRDVDANSRNTIVKGIHDGANFFAGAFTGLVTFKGHAKRELTVDWGIALLVYLILGALLARSIQRLGYRGLHYKRGNRLAA